MTVCFFFDRINYVNSKNGYGRFNTFYGRFMTESTIICQSALQYTHTNKENPKRGRRGKL